MSLTTTLWNALVEERVRYCHWKSNDRLGEVNRGEVELDLLVDPADAETFESIVGRLGFCRVVDTPIAQIPGVFHLFGYDESRDVVVHLHVYYQLVTGESLTKNYRLPIEGFFWENLRRSGEVPVPGREAELAVLSIRLMLKHASLIEHLMLRRSRQKVESELSWLRDGSSGDRWRSAIDGLLVYLPTLDRPLLDEALSCLTGRFGWRGWRLAHRFRRRLRPYARRSRLRAGALTVVRFTDRLVGKALGRGNRKRRADGGRVIAFVGPEASGKSSLVRAVGESLSIGMGTAEIHFGKPPPTLLSSPSRLVLPLARRIAPTARSTEVVQASATTSSESLPTARGRAQLLFAVRSVLIAWDRLALARRNSRLAGSGVVVLTDRYPCTTPGRADGPRLQSDPMPNGGGRLTRWLSRIEARLYAAVPPPDLLVSLQVPLETAVTRNEIRIKDKKESAGYVTVRHGLVGEYDHPHTRHVELSTEGELAQVQLAARAAVWGSL